MKPFLVVAATALLGASVTVATAQSGMATAPADRSTGPTVPDPAPTDTRQIDQSIANAPASAGSAMTTMLPNSENWRSSNGMNADPDNPAGAPSAGPGRER